MKKRLGAEKQMETCYLYKGMVKGERKPKETKRKKNGRKGKQQTKKDEDQ